MQSLVSRLALCALILSPTSALAYSDGQWGFSGRVDDQSCLACHGIEQFQGMRMELNTEDTIECSTEEGAEPFQIPVLMAGETYQATVTVDPVSSDQVPCPGNTCCNGDAVEGDACLNRPDSGLCTVENQQQCCQPGLDVCGDPVAGFNAEVVGGGAFVAGESTKLLSNGGEEDPSEISHTSPANAGGGASWTFNYTAPADDQVGSAVEFWVGANVANGNGFADPNDLNANYQLAAAVQKSDGSLEVPGYCLVCPNGNPPVAGCCCNATVSEDFGPRGTYLAFALLSLLGFAFTRKRAGR